MVSHIIRFSNDQDRKRAIRAFLEVPTSRMRFAGGIMAVGDTHIRALKENNIPFEYVSKTLELGDN